MATTAAQYAKFEMERVLKLLECLSIQEIVENRKFVRTLTVCERILKKMSDDVPSTKLSRIHRALLDKVSVEEVYRNIDLQKHIVDEIYLSKRAKLGVVPNIKRFER